MMFDVNSLTVSDIQERIVKNRHLKPYPPEVSTDNDLVEAAVLVLLVRQDDRWHLVLTRRTDTVRDHKGQVAFPGGAREEIDGSLVITALRETWEEIGIPPNKIQVLGCMPAVETISSYCITPVIATTSWPQKLEPARDEVERVFTIPVDWLADPTHWDNRSFTLPGTNRTRTTIQYHEYDQEVLWGISAMITQTLIEMLKEHPAGE